MPPHLLRRLAGWLVGAMLLATLAPAVSRTLAASRQAGEWVEICTAQGMRWMQLEVEQVHPDVSLGDVALNALDHCGHCALTAERFAPLTPSLPVVAIFKEAWSTPAYRDGPQRSIEALSPSARGPPYI